MKVRESSLTHRFYTSEGWTREAVASFMKEPNVDYVHPRWYDGEKDRQMMNLYKGEAFMFVSPEQVEFPDCDYYAIHNPAIELDMTRLSSEHEVIPFSMPATEGF